jgi:hypothetical protein
MRDYESSTYGETPSSAHSRSGSGAAEVALLRPASPRLADDAALQHLWISLQQRSWRSLAVLSASADIASLDVAHALARIAWSYTGQPVCIFDMRDASLRLLERRMREMASQLHGGERVFVALRPLS